MVAGGQLTVRARRALTGLSTAASQTPGWFDWIGAAEPTSAWRASDPCGDQDGIMIGFRYPDGHEHCLSILVDHLLGGIAKDAAALEASIDEVLPQWTSDAGIDLVEEPEPEPLTAAEREALVHTFLADGAGKRFAHDPDAWFLLDALVDYRCDRGGDPLRWSGCAAELFLLHWVPRKLSAPDALLERAAEILRAWVPWAVARAGLPAHLAEQTLGVIAELGSEPIQALRDQRCWGPAKRIALGMFADGVDPSDEDAVDAWCRAASESHRCFTRS